MRILHTADWHLGRIFHQVHMTEDQAAVLDQFIDLIKDRRPHAVIVAGDIYDRSVPPVDAVRLLDEVITRILLDHRTAVIMVAGNHDSADRLGFGNRLFAGRGFHLFGRLDRDMAPIPVEDETGPVWFCPIPYAEPALVRETFGSSPEAVRGHNEALRVLADHMSARTPAGARRIAVAHAFVTGGEQSESESFLTVGGAGTVDGSIFEGFHYTALGHLHRPQHCGHDRIRYSGSLLKYSFSEADHQKGITFVELDGAGQITACESIALTPRRDVRRLEGYLNDILKGAAPGENRQDYVMVTLLDEGAILDPIGKIRQVYPNVLHIQRTFLERGSGAVRSVGDHRRLDDLDLFASFMEQVTGSPLDEEGRQVAADVIDDVLGRCREVAP
ncbi:exonuclease sbcd [Heliomicrobium modesticaldum Ice1]|uniref:Nuclease SbcCD subunit D n=1 Tax=Heliobacterium modesticaldum (strain ATCC 51547 / Ice1) TaxID=498761 RepID=B0TDB7_HELMI|nr:exonuclease SbcCD subunit D [Heliomicrobium modesticaldum]ABZ84158.1 exonuclease sbcd [Heliomicrobium modesticaldum Ice1]